MFDGICWECVVLQPEELEGIRGNAALVMSKFTPVAGFELGLDERSVRWIEGMLERQRARGPGHAQELVNLVGSYLGEAIIAAAGGTWGREAHGWIGICFSEGNWAFPFAKVSKQAEAGLEGGESIASFYTICRDLVATGKLAESSRQEGPHPASDSESS